MLLVSAWFAPSATAAAAFSGDLVIERRENSTVTRDGVMTADNVIMTHGADTRINAGHFRYTDRGQTSELDLTGKVQIEFRGALLDAESAVLKFRGKNLVTIAVKGSQAQFSYKPENYPRRIHGLADAIEFDAATTEVKFSGNTSYEDGRHYFDEETVYYNITTGVARDDGDPATRGKTIIRLGEGPDRVPPPRQPERSTAQ